MKEYGRKGWAHVSRISLCVLLFAGIMLISRVDKPVDVNTQILIGILVVDCLVFCLAIINNKNLHYYKITYFPDCIIAENMFNKKNIFRTDSKITASIYLMGIVLENSYGESLSMAIDNRIIKDLTIYGFEFSHKYE